MSVIEATKAYKPHAISAYQIDPGDLISLDHFFGLVKVESIEPIDDGPIGYAAPWVQTFKLHVKAASVADLVDGRTYIVARYGGEAMTRWEWE